MTQRTTPMLAQYRQIKARFPDAIVFFRLGDFYETFDQDAHTTSRELELALTSRSFSKDVRLPMAGVPHHHAQAYIAKLIERGYKVAMVEQLEDPKKVKRLVKRDVVRIITPGTVVEDTLLNAKNENFMATIVRGSPMQKPGREANAYGLALVDLSTGEFATTQIEGAEATARLLDELQRIHVSEYVLPPALMDDEPFIARLKAIRPARLSPIDEQSCNDHLAYQALIEHLGIPTLDAYGCEHLPLAISAAGAALHYLQSNLPTGVAASSLKHLNRLWTFSLADYMTLDASTRRNLELNSSLHEGNQSPHTLFNVLDRTVTAMGARLLRRWVSQPLLDLAQIHARLEAVDELVHTAFLRQDLRRLLDGLYDVERLVGRIGFGSANARDLIALKHTLLRLPQIKAQLAQAGSAHLRELENNLDALQDVAGLIDHAIINEPPIFVREGGLIKESYDGSLDQLRQQALDDKQWLNELEEKERQKTGIKKLRLSYNQVFGFFIEAPRSAAALIPPEYERRATTTHTERYVTPELKAQEARILATEDRINDLEYDLFTQVRSAVAEHSARLQAAARTLAQLDVLCALAKAAACFNYTRPVVDDGDVIEIRQGRHPVVERFVREGEQFVPNDIRLDRNTQRLIVLTGPNMSGKSVLVRQVALIALMAQMGSFVPAEFARVGLTDRIFTRAGASDDVARGRSTFLVEMNEVGYILRHASPRSLIVLDEAGRGTSTYDGISLAWAIAEELHDIVCAKTLFATHYHELTRLEEALGPTVKNYTMAIAERGDQVIFLRQVIPGSAAKSFGLHVAQMAGLPGRVISRAEDVLQNLEHARGPEPHTQLVREERATYNAHAELWHNLFQQLVLIDIANLTPLQALNLLNEIQLKIKET